VKRAIVIIGKSLGQLPVPDRVGDFEVLRLCDVPPRPAPTPRFERLAVMRDVELSASWLLLASGREGDAVSGDVRSRFAGSMVVHGPGELSRALARISLEASRSRVLTDYREAAQRCQRLHARGKSIVFTNGVFDLFHIGHLRLLAAARTLGDCLVVGVNSDQSAARLKGGSGPVMPQFARAELVAGVRGVGFCVIFTEDDPRAVLKLIRPDVLAKGSEYDLSEVVGRKLVESWGGRVALLPHLGGWSSTELKARIRRRRA
jgi:D-beta-D-heptose 7-phosphate kinase/D-beta-D-heptose 1-phosphate adenosyltransferase